MNKELCATCAARLWWIQHAEVAASKVLQDQSGGGCSQSNLGFGEDFLGNGGAGLLSYVQLFVTLWAAAHQTPLSMGLFQARILEQVAISFSRGTSPPRNGTTSPVSPILAGGFFTSKLPGKS